MKELILPIPKLFGLIFNPTQVPFFFWFSSLDIRQPLKLDYYGIELLRSDPQGGKLSLTSFFLFTRLKLETLLKGHQTFSTRANICWSQVPF